MTGSQVLSHDIEALEAAYIDAAAELHAKQMKMQSCGDELEALLGVRDELKLHPEFSGTLPMTFYSGSEVDPDGVDGKQGLDWGESGRTNWH